MVVIFMSNSNVWLWSHSVTGYSPFRTESLFWWSAFWFDCQGWGETPRCSQTESVCQMWSNCLRFKWFSLSDSHFFPLNTFSWQIQTCVWIIQEWQTSQTENSKQRKWGIRHETLSHTYNSGNISATGALICMNTLRGRKTLSQECFAHCVPSEIFIPAPDQVSPS